MMRLAISLAAAITALAAPVLADPISIGILSDTPYTDPGSWASLGPVTQDYTFSIGAHGALVDGNLSPDYGLENFTAKLTGPGGYTAPTVNVDGDTPLNFGQLAAGNYTLSLTGTPTLPRHQTVIGGYTLTIRAVAAPVPGPAGWLVAVAGVALIGFTQRHRLRKTGLA